MSNENYLNKIKDLPETIKQFGGLVLIVLIIFFSFSVLNIMFGGGDEGTKEVHDKILEEQVVELKDEITILRREMKSYFGTGGTAYTEFGRSTQTALENAS